MTAYTKMPVDTPFKPGDIFLERGFAITTVEGGKANHEDIGNLLLRPVEIEATDPAQVQEISSQLKTLAKEVEKL